MRKASIWVHGVEAGILEELPQGGYRFTYHSSYSGPPVSLRMPTKEKIYHFPQFPAFFEGLLPEGIMLEGLLRQYKLDRNDYFGQLLKVGGDVVGAVTIKELS